MFKPFRLIALAALTIGCSLLRAQQGDWVLVTQTPKVTIEWKPSSLKSTPAEYWNPNDRYLTAWVRKTYLGDISPNRPKIQMYELYICRDRMLITYKADYDSDGNEMDSVQNPIHAMDTFNWTPIVPDSEVDQVRRAMVSEARSRGYPMGYN